MAKRTARRRTRTPFLKSKMLFWILMIVFFPLALFILWKYKPYGKIGRAAITLLTSFVIFSIPFGYYFYQQYAAQQDQLALEAEARANDPFFGYDPDSVTLEQAGFLKFYSGIDTELKTYKDISDDFSVLFEAVRKNSKVNSSIMNAHIDSYITRLDQSIENIDKLTVPASLSADKAAALNASRQKYVQLIQELRDDFSTMKSSIASDRRDAKEDSAAAIANNQKAVAAVKNEFKDIGTQLNVSILTKKQLIPASNSYTPAPATQPRQSVSVATNHATAPSSNQPVSINVGKETISGDVISIYD